MGHGTTGRVRDVKTRDVEAGRLPARPFDPRSPAVVLGLFDTGLAASRSLGRVGISVLGLDADRRMPGFHSRFCTATQCPDPVAEPDELLEFLLREGRRFDRPAVLYPATDAYVWFCSRRRAELGQAYRFALPPFDVLESLLDKRRQYQLAEQRGIPIPTTAYPRTPEEVREIKDRIRYPVFVKGCYAHLWRLRFDTKGFRVESPAELVRAFELVQRAGLQAMVQSIIVGPPTNNFEASFYVTQTGEVPACLTVRKLRQYPTQFGVGTLVETIDCPKLATLAMDLIRGLDYRGFGNVEFKLDPEDGRLKLIELNARLWQQNDHAAACGINFPLMQYLDLTGQPIDPPAPVPVGVKWVDPMADFQSFWSHFRQGELSLGAWLRSWRGARAFAVLAADDPLPGLASIGFGAKLLRLPIYLLRHRAAVE